MFHTRPRMRQQDLGGRDRLPQQLRRTTKIVSAVGTSRHMSSLVVLCSISILASVTPASAHGGEHLTTQKVSSAWELTADIAFPTAAVAIIYLRGMVRRAAFKRQIWRHALFFIGLGAIFLALQSPIDPLAERLFFVHQIQHLLLRMVGPMLVALAQPQAMLIAGLPKKARRTILAPLASSSSARRVFGFMTHPVVATTIFIASLYVWQIPRYHNRALLNEPLHYLMHVTMLMAGGFFWWLIFDQRAQPKSLRHGVRLMMLWIAILSNILLGSYITLKTTILYDAYDQLGRLYQFSPQADEHLGGLIIWIPSSMMCLLAVLIVIHQFGNYEALMEERRKTWSPRNSDILLYPTTGAALIEQARPKNRAMAFGFALFSAFMFSVAILSGLVSQSNFLPKANHSQHAYSSHHEETTTNLF
jgi:putative membrane protein